MAQCHVGQVHRNICAYFLNLRFPLWYTPFSQAFRGKAVITLGIAHTLSIFLHSSFKASASMYESYLCITHPSVSTSVTLYKRTTQVPTLRSRAHKVTYLSWFVDISVKMREADICNRHLADFTVYIRNPVVMSPGSPYRAQRETLNLFGSRAVCL